MNLFHSEEVNYSNNLPSPGDIILIRNRPHEVICTRMGYRLMHEGKLNMTVGIHETIKTFVAAIREQNWWNTPRSVQRTHDLRTLG
jgi:hypothetical protein